ncbi:acyl-CoA N-acyltransferase [Anaeromyces robustus]|uniref:Acyl-CoA N-acyltransferase n=1 Tax=Anaeromyces robustus TaxID=1754192 RepID=A0A1Y1WZH9_9FUNG|nr:acyl-CoA N-acyltransferase [Anaeromyces robustus]|eukprot:ORX78961.1 acyl-CoA N-acyltransferase [Anaeromyces robustus]
MKDEKLIIRKATKDDVSIIFKLIHGLAKYEKRPQDVTGNEKQLSHWLFERNIATVLLGEYKGEAVAYAIYYPVFASFATTGKVHLEDLFVQKELRGKGFGKKMMAYVANEVLTTGYTGMEWSCLDWNEPSIEFYKHIGAELETGRVYFDFDRSQLETISKEL